MAISYAVFTLVALANAAIYECNDVLVDYYSDPLQDPHWARARATPAFRDHPMTSRDWNYYGAEAFDIILDHFGYDFRWSVYDPAHGSYTLPDHVCLYMISEAYMNQEPKMYTAGYLLATPYGYAYPYLHTAAVFPNGDMYYYNYTSTHYQATY